mmetsp:Transcript_13851/g.26078  ORF Transcript_13851/g.26078 Transcript_13851/m.26078 type:complete len:220 (-) Transcript_13851:2937-3596(-)
MNIKLSLFPYRGTIVQEKCMNKPFHTILVDNILLRKTYMSRNNQKYPPIHRFLCINRPPSKVKTNFMIFIHCLTPLKDQTTFSRIILLLHHLLPIGSSSSSSSSSSSTTGTRTCGYSPAPRCLVLNVRRESSMFSNVVDHVVVSDARTFWGTCVPSGDQERLEFFSSFEKKNDDDGRPSTIGAVVEIMVHHHPQLLCWDRSMTNCQRCMPKDIQIRLEL